MSLLTVSIHRILIARTLCRKDGRGQVAKKGKEYERFVYGKFKRLFIDSTVKLNDKIVGRESGLVREIDVSIRTPMADQELLYIVQCKDRGKRPADIVILGEFSAVIRDVGAAKGFLICTSGFAKTNYRYARTLGIELLTVEDIKSDRWKVGEEQVARRQPSPQLPRRQLVADQRRGRVAAVV